jgi:hypothetical protein
MRRTLQRGERSIRVTNDVKTEVEVIGELSLELNNDFILAYIIFSMYHL